jgi:hypothetical protein
MARRKQKFTFAHLLLLAVAMIWLPALIGRLAGIPSEEFPTPPPDSESPQPLDVEAVSHVRPQDSDQTDSPHLRPAPEGLVLTETLVSASGKTAVINGLAFREGQILHQTGYPLRIRSILPGKVILEGDGGLYELRRRSIFE